MTHLKKNLTPFLLIILGILLALLFYILIYVPHQTKLQQLQNQHSSLEKEWLEQINVKEALKSKLVKQKETVEIPQRLLADIPASVDVPSLLNKWSEKSKPLGVRVLTFETAEETTFGEVTETILRMKLEGTFHQILSFLEILSSTEKKLLISNIEMSKPLFKQGEYVISTSTSLSIYQKKGGK